MPLARDHGSHHFVGVQTALHQAFGAAFATNTGFSFRVSVNNVFNNEGLSEGDPRSGTNVIDPTVSFFNARPIQPRTITGTASYRF